MTKPKRTWEDYQKTMVREPDLFTVVKAGRIELIPGLLARGVRLNDLDHRGYSALMLAAYAGQVAMVQELIRLGADVNSADATGNTILMGVCFKGNLQIAKQLIEAKANIHSLNQSGLDAYAIARTFGRSEIVSLLEAHGVSQIPSSRIFNFLKLIKLRVKQKLKSAV